MSCSKEKRKGKELNNKRNTANIFLRVLRVQYMRHESRVVNKQDVILYEATGNTFKGAHEKRQEREEHEKGKSPLSLFFAENKEREEL